MIKNIAFLTIALLFLICHPAIAEEHNAYACNENSGECYDADADLDFGVVTLYFSSSNYKMIQIDEYEPDNITAYDENTKTYYTIEIIK